MATIVKKSLVPEYEKPRACAWLRCEMRLERPDDPERAAAVFVHQDPDGSVDEYSIPRALFEDVSYDIWCKDIKPWLESLHTAPAST